MSFQLAAKSPKTNTENKRTESSPPVQELRTHGADVCSIRDDMRLHTQRQIKSFRGGGGLSQREPHGANAGRFHKPSHDMPMQRRVLVSRGSGLKKEGCSDRLRHSSQLSISTLLHLTSGGWTRPTRRSTGALAQMATREARTRGSVCCVTFVLSVCALDEMR